MRLTEFSITNYRSITSASKIKLDNLTVLVGKNNEGKSNLLRALDVAMSAMTLFARYGKRAFGSRTIANRAQEEYDWEKDFPLKLQGRSKNTESRFKLLFRLSKEELVEFTKLTGIHGNTDIPIVVTIDKNSNFKIDIPKRGAASYKSKAQIVIQYIADRISYIYIPAIRTDDIATRTVEKAFDNEIRSVLEDPEYIKAQEKINSLMQAKLNTLSPQLLATMQVFLPNVSDVTLKWNGSADSLSRPFLRNWLDVIVNDGTPTSIKNKGDGVKNLLALATLVKQKKRTGASIVAIEEPESHLHPGAVHNLAKIIREISETSQVVLTTHSPAFVRQNKISSNIIVGNGEAKPARNIDAIREALGVWPSDNLKNARYVLLVEGPNDKTALAKILPTLSSKIGHALQENLLVIKPMLGVANLKHELNDLHSSLCEAIILLDNDEEAQKAIRTAETENVVGEYIVKYTSNAVMKESEFEDCIKPEVYASEMQGKFSVDMLHTRVSRRMKWSEWIENVFREQGAHWREDSKKVAKQIVADAIPQQIATPDEVLDTERSGFMTALVVALEKMLDNGLS